MATQGSYLRSPVVITYRRTQRSKKKLIKILRGKTSDNIDKIVESKVYGINENTVIDHVGIGYKYIPKDKLTAADRKAIQAIVDETLKNTAN
jgi:hypothetical protein